MQLQFWILMLFKAEVGLANTLELAILDISLQEKYPGQVQMSSAVGRERPANAGGFNSSACSDTADASADEPTGRGSTIVATATVSMAETTLSPILLVAGSVSMIATIFSVARKVLRMALVKISGEGTWISGMTRGVLDGDVLAKGVFMEEELLLGLVGMRFSEGCPDFGS